LVLNRKNRLRSGLVISHWAGETRTIARRLQGGRLQVSISLSDQTLEKPTRGGVETWRDRKKILDAQVLVDHHARRARVEGSAEVT